MTQGMKIEALSFADGQSIPQRFTSDGEDLSPQLRWSGIPENTGELALLVDDPDAPRKKPFVHWVVFHIPKNSMGLPEGVPHMDGRSLQSGMVQGRNDFGAIGYSGPAPPKGHGTHHYHFRLFALDSHLNLQPGCTAEELFEAMRGHILTEADYVGTYAR